MKIKIHESLIILILFSYLTGFINKILILFIVILLHETGHLLALKIFKREIKELNLLPFGAIINYHDLKNKKLYEELIITSAGIFVNIFILLSSKFIVINKTFLEFNKLILIFNMLPIFPLDGGRLIEIIFEYFLCFNKVQDKFIKLSFLNMLLLGLYIFLFNLSINALLVYFYLLTTNIKYYKNKKRRYVTFLINKYLFENKKLNIKILQNKPYIENLYKGVNNFTLDKTEKEILTDYFKSN